MMMSSSCGKDGGLSAYKLVFYRLRNNMYVLKKQCRHFSIATITNLCEIKISIAKRDLY